MAGSAIDCGVDDTGTDLCAAQLIDQCVIKNALNFTLTALT